jgi:hypothetical protein
MLVTKFYQYGNFVMIVGKDYGVGRGMTTTIVIAVRPAFVGISQ